MGLPINPPGSTLGTENSVLSGTGTRYFVPDFEGCLSIKTVLNGSAIWEAGKRTFSVDQRSYLILNDRQRYTITIEAVQPVTTFCLFFERGYVEDIHHTLVGRTTELLDNPYASKAGQFGCFEALRPIDPALRTSLSRFFLRLQGISWIEWGERFLEFGEMLVRSQAEAAREISQFPAVRASTRIEIYRRAEWT